MLFHYLFWLNGWSEWWEIVRKMKNQLQLLAFFDSVVVSGSTAVWVVVSDGLLWLLKGVVVISPPLPTELIKSFVGIHMIQEKALALKGTQTLMLTKEKKTALEEKRTNKQTNRIYLHRPITTSFRDGCYICFTTGSWTVKRTCSPTLYLLH